MFSKEGLTNIFNTSSCQSELVESQSTNHNLQRIFNLQINYINTIDSVIAFLQGKNPTLARQICSGNFLPEALRFEQLDDLEWAFGSMGMQDKAKHLATLY